MQHFDVAGVAALSVANINKQCTSVGIFMRMSVAGRIRQLMEHIMEMGG